MTGRLLAALRPHAGPLAVFALVTLGVPAEAAPATETERVEKTVPLQPGGTLKLKNFSGRVEITGGDRKDVHLVAIRKASREKLDRIQLDIQSDGRQVSIEANKRSGWGLHDNVVETDMVIQVPAKTNLDVDVFSSPVTVTGVAGTHRVETFSADLRLARVDGPIEAESFSGTIAIAEDTWADGRHLSVKTFSGDIDVRLPAAASGSVEFDSFSGDLQSDHTLTLQSKSKRTIRALLNTKDGAAPASSLQFKTFSGDVTLRK